MNDKHGLETTGDGRLEALERTRISGSPVTGHPSPVVLLERWQEIEVVLQGALDRPLRERASFLEEACAGDESRRRPRRDLAWD